MPVAIDYSQILFDGSGKPYWRRQDGSKVYLPPLVAMQSNDPRAVEWARSMGVYRDEAGQVTNQSAPGSSLFKERGHWDQDTGGWKQDTNWNNIASIGVGAMMGAPYLAGAFGGGAASPAAAASQGSAAANGTLASSSIPGLHTAVPGAIASQGASATVPIAQRLLGGGGGGVLDALKGFGSDALKRFASPEGALNLAGLFSALAGKPQDMSKDPQVKAQMDLMLDRQRMENERYKRVDPMHEAVTRLAYSRLPIAARNP